MKAQKNLKSRLRKAVAMELLNTVMKAENGQKKMIFGKPFTYSGGKWVSDKGGKARRLEYEQRTAPKKDRAPGPAPIVKKPSMPPEERVKESKKEDDLKRKTKPTNSDRQIEIYHSMKTLGIDHAKKLDDLIDKAGSIKNLQFALRDALKGKKVDILRDDYKKPEESKPHGDRYITESPWGEGKKHYF